MTEKKSYGRSTAGVEPTDEVLQEMARQAEAGLDVTKLRRRVALPVRPARWTILDGPGPADAKPSDHVEVPVEEHAERPRISRRLLGHFLVGQRHHLY